MRKLLLLLGAVAGMLIGTSSQEAKADCGFGYGVAYPSYSYAPVYSVPRYGYTTYGYAPVYSNYGASYYRPGVSVVIGSGYRGYNYGGGYGHHHHHHHRHHGHW